MPTVSVVIPSIGRIAGVRGILDTIASGSSPDAEVIVVDNTPDRASGLDGLAGPGVRVLHEPNAGAARARNRGAAEASGRVLVFIDDDVQIAADTVRELATPVLSGEAVAAVTRITLDPDVELPSWLAPPWFGLLSRYDRGERPFDLDIDDHGLTAAMAVDRERFRDVGGFWERLGPRPECQRTNDDVQLCRALRRTGATIRYAPDAGVVHEVPPARLERRYLTRRAFEQGRSDWVLEHGWEGRPRREVVSDARHSLVHDQLANLRRVRELRSLGARLVLTAARFAGVVVAAVKEPRP